MKYPKTTLILSTLLLCSTAFGKPAMRGIRTVSQPDGSKLEIIVEGDEHFHYTATPSGLLLTKDSDGFYRLARLEADGAITSTGIFPSDAKALLAATPVSELDLGKIRARRMLKRNAPQSGIGMSSSTYPTTGHPKGLVILVEYSDVKFNSSYNAQAYFNGLINGEHFTDFGATGSAYQYFNEQSGGKFVPSFDVLGPVTLPNKQAYYGKNDRYGEDQHPEQMVVQAIESLDSTVDFSIYDTDGDGIIDNVYVFYAGQGEADYGDDDTVWPHAWDVRNAGINKKVDGVYIGHYACSNEWSEKAPDGLGTFIHEFSHVMGLPDLYDTVNASADYTPSDFSVLDYGPYLNDSRTPPNYGAYEKNALGWFEPIILDGPMSVELRAISSGDFALIPTDNVNEFFLLENRQLTGWDAYIPASGMLIWHIDYNKKVFDDNEVNNTKNHQRVDIVEANEKVSYKYASGFTFPGTTGKTEFTPTSSPALKNWAGKGIDLPITNISDNGMLVTFDVAGGGELMTEVGSVVSDETSPVYYNMQGLPVVTPLPGMLLIEKKGDKVRKIIF